VSAIVPAFEEAARIAAVLAVLVSYPGFGEVVVVDDGSSDDTVEVASAAGARVVRQPRQAGKGAAMDRGVGAARGNVLFFCDADMRGLTHAMIDDILGPVVRGEVEMFVGMIDRAIYRGPYVERWVPLLGGTRALTRELWDRTPRRFKRGFAIETALNYYHDHGSRPGRKVLPGLGQTVKERKYGVFRGTRLRLRMIREIVTANVVLRLSGERSFLGGASWRS
jgi:glycosyltransferase involved in cell wall biosynthesis